MSGRFASLFTAVLGGLAVRLSLSGEYLNFVRPSMFRWLMAAGVFLVLLGVGGWMRSLVSDDRDHQDDHHGHSHGLSRAAWLLLLPLLAATLTQPAPLGSFAANRQASRPPRPSRTASLAQKTIDLKTPAPAASDVAGIPIPLGASPAQEMSLLDFLEISYYDETKALKGVPVTITGFAMPAPGKSREFLLSRFVISCCAADAQLMQTGVTGVPGNIPAQDSWVSVTGVWDPDASSEKGADGFPLPKLFARTVEEIEQPENPYVSLTP